MPKLAPTHRRWFARGMSKPSGYVKNIYTAREAGQPMSETDMVMLLKGRGIAGDRYGEGVGSFSNAKRPVIRQVTLIAIEAIDLANKELDNPYEPEETRRNILTDGIEDLGELVGRDFKIGAAVLRGVEICNPCKRPETLTGKLGFNDAYKTRDGHPAYGGIRAEVMESGIVAVGYGIELA